MAAEKIALVTGAGTGIGRAATIHLAKTGWNVVLAGRRKEPLEEAAGEAKKSGVKTLIVPTDVTKVDDIKALFKKTMDTFGRLDFLFNNAGIGAPPVYIDELPIEKYKEVVDTNLTAMFICTQEAFRIMRHQKPMGGRIVNNGSISAYAPRPRSIAYTSTKHGVSGLTKTTALDGRDFNIACGQIDVGNANTPLASRMANGVLQADLSTKPEPLMDVDHVGQAVAFMASMPLETNILFLNIKATKMPFEGRG